MNAELFSGAGKLELLPELLSGHSARSVFLVTGKQSYTASGAERLLSKLLSRCQVTRFHEFRRNPQIEDLKRGIALFKQKTHDLVLAVGGGSVLDMAKLINVLAVQDSAPEDYITGKKQLGERGKPLIAVPTTAGSGSEATHFAVVYVDKQKFSLAAEGILPDAVVLDPRLLMNTPQAVAAASGLDALSQAIESYWSINSNTESQLYAKQAIELILENLTVSLSKASEELWFAMQQAAHAAGKAINITKTTAPHALSYVFTSHYGVAHGHAVALTLGEILVLNSEVDEENVSDPRGAAYVKTVIDELNCMFGARDAGQSADRLKVLMRQIGLETRLSDLNIDRHQITDKLLKEVNLERLKNNPRRLSTADISAIIENIA